MPGTSGSTRGGIKAGNVMLGGVMLEVFCFGPGVAVGR